MEPIGADFRLLGPFEVEHEGRLMQVGRRRERCLLGLLLLEPNTPVPTNRLIDLLWDGAPPATGRAGLRTHVSRLRSRLDPDGNGRLGLRLISRDAGLLAQVDRSLVDVHRFSDLVGRAGGADLPERARLLRQALALWRGPILADVATPMLRDRVGVELEELRRVSTEAMVDAELDRGHHHEMVGPLSAWVAEDPLRERLVGQLMLALYRSDRHTEALSVYQRLCTRLADEIGTSPAPPLVDLYAAMLRRDPELAAPPTPAPPAPMPGSPAQLPGAPGWFTGRAGDLALLTKALTDGGVGRSGGSEAVVAIVGPGGVGKTWLALHWAHQHTARYPDGQLFVDLRGFDPAGEPMPPTTAVHGFLTALGVPSASIPADPHAQVGLYRNSIAGRRMLVVLDNARSSEEVVPLLPGSPTCTVLVTSRDRLPGLVGAHAAHRLLLDVLDPGDARQVLADRLGSERLAVEREAVDAVVSRCGGLPLALSIAAGRAAASPGLQLADLAAEMRDSGTRLSALDEDDPSASLSAMLSSSYSALNPERARLFGLLGLSTGAVTSLAAVAALGVLSTARAEAMLRTLEQVSLVHQQAPGRFRIHDLVRLYAAERIRLDQPAAEPDKALRRLIDFYVHTAYAADRLLDPHRAPIELGPQPPGCRPEHLSDADAALAWFTEEHANVLAAQRLAHEHGWHDLVGLLAWGLATFHYRRGYLSEEIGTWETALEAAERSGDAAAQRLAHRLLGRVHSRAGWHAEATAHLERALTLAQEGGNLAEEVLTRHALSLASSRRADNEQALEHSREVLRPLVTVGEPTRAVRLDRAAEELATAVKQQWTAEAEIRSLHRPAPVRVRWSTTGRPVTGEHEPLRGDILDVAVKFCRLANRQLVIIGEPGAGKTVLATLLTLGLLADRGSGDPTPVLLSLSSWNPHREHPHSWLARRMVEDYPGLGNAKAYGRDAAACLVAEDRVIPVLDGLDETAPGVHAAAIDALDQAIGGGRPLVVTCRAAEYEDAVRHGDILAGAAVVEIEPVELDDAVTFLTAGRLPGDTRWEPVVEHLRQHRDGPLARALSTPLMVDLARTTYRDVASDPAELIDRQRFGDRAVIEDHLLGAFLPAVYARRPQPPGLPLSTVRGHGPDQARRWLTFLACHLRNLRTRDFAWWQLVDAIPRHVRGLVFGLPPAALFAIVGLLARGPAAAWAYGLSTAAGGFAAQGWGTRSAPSRVEFRFRGTALAFLGRAVIGVAISVVIRRLWSLSIAPVVILALAFGLGTGLPVWLKTPTKVDQASSPATTYAQDRVATVAFASSVAVSIGLFYAFAISVSQPHSNLGPVADPFHLNRALPAGAVSALFGWIAFRYVGAASYGFAGFVVGGLAMAHHISLGLGLAAGAIFGLAVGLTAALSRSWGIYQVSLAWLALRGRTPAQLNRFLQDAHRRGVLRLAGALYQFRHTRLQDRLADGGPPRR
jgi:DNA-binding SARP family transcriptional activator/tetratricopeptide (TPR) repeat protein